MANFSHKKSQQMVRLKVVFNQVGRSHILTLSVHHFYLNLMLTLILLMWRIWWAPNNGSRWQMGFNLAFKWLYEMAVKRFALFPLHKQFEKHGSMPDPPFPKSDSRAGDTSSELKRPGREPGQSHKSSTVFKNKSFMLALSHTPSFRAQWRYLYLYLYLYLTVVTHDLMKIQQRFPSCCVSEWLNNLLRR
jgi:hypothetical protein